jgi:hypothetical protein
MCPDQGRIGRNRFAETIHKSVASYRMAGFCIVSMAAGATPRSSISTSIPHSIFCARMRAPGIAEEDRSAAVKGLDSFLGQFALPGRYR